MEKGHLLPDWSFLPGPSGGGMRWVLYLLGQGAGGGAGPVLTWPGEGQSGSPTGSLLSGQVEGMAQGGKTGWISHLPC